jgi:hypothetical protein
MLGASTSNALKDALFGAHGWSKTLADGNKIEVEWLSDQYVSPVDGRTLFSQHGWQEHLPAGARKGWRQRILLLSSENEIAMAVAIEDLGAYVRSVSQQLGDLLDFTEGPRQTLYVQFELAPGRTPLVTAKCEPVGQLAPELMAKIGAVAAPAVRDKIAFQLVVELGCEA